MGNLSSLPASATQSQGQVERLKFVSEEQKVAARLAPMLANNVDIACILKGIERCLPFFDFDDLCSLEGVSKSIKKLIHENGFYLWNDLLHHCTSLKPGYNRNIFYEKHLKHPSPLCLKLQLIRSKQNEVDDELAHVLQVTPFRNLLHEVEEKHKNDYDIVVYGLVCDLVTSKIPGFADIISRVRPAAMSTIVVANMKSLIAVKNCCANSSKYVSMLGQLGFVTWTPEAERKRLIVEKLTTTSKKQQNLANMPGYFERAEELLCLQPPENTPGYIGRADELLRLQSHFWYLRGAIKQIFSFILVFQDEISAQEYVEQVNSSTDVRNREKIHYVAMDMFESKIPFGTKGDFVTYYARKENSKCYRGPSYRRALTRLEHDMTQYEKDFYKRSGLRISPLSFRDLDDNNYHSRLAKKKNALNISALKILSEIS